MRESKLLEVLDRALEQVSAQQEKAITSKRIQEGTAEWYAAHAHAENTYRAYRSAIKDYIRWAGIPFPFPSPPELVARYLSDRARKYKRSTLQQRLQAIAFVHRMLEMDDPTTDRWVRQVMKGIRKQKAKTEHDGTQNPRRGRIQAPTFSVDEFRRMIDETWKNDCLRNLRDRTYLLLGVYGAFRQSELNRLAVAHLEWADKELVIRPGPVKQDQENRHDFVKALPSIEDPRYCPVVSLRAWLDRSGIDAGPIFRRISKGGKVGTDALSHQATNTLIKKWAAKAGLDNPALFSGHSLRASFVTILRGLGLTDGQIARQTHHLNLQMMNVYDRPRDALLDTPARRLGAALLNKEER